MENNFKTTIGLEIHVQLATKSKMFCRCNNESDKAEPNTNVCPRCLGMPGTLPVANRQAIEWTIKTGMALNCEIPEESKFDRKHYFYPDLPKGYQISQYDQPLCVGGWLEIKNQKSKIKNIEDDSDSNLVKKVILNRIHLEEDAGKLVHRGNNSLVDLNRAGTPLMEIVTEPCIESPAEAKEFLQELQLLIRYLKVSEASMEKGHLRCDANISVQVKSQSSTGSDCPEREPNGQKSKVKSKEGDADLISSEIVEIKNLNSFKFVEKALLFEEKRLREEYPNWPEKLKKVTRGFDSDKGVTFAQRQKEEASDYRYFPEPDVPAIKIKNQKLVPGIPEGSKIKNAEGDFDLDKIKASIGHLPNDLRQKMVQNEIPEHVGEKIINNPEHAWYLMEAEMLEKDLALWVTEEVNAQIAAHKISYRDYKKQVPITHLADLLAFVKAGKISSSVAKEVFAEMVRSGQRAVEIIKSRKLEQISDDSEIEAIVHKVMEKNPAEIERLKAGDTKLIGFLVGQIMRESGGRANPKVAGEILNKLVD